jgi:hypothetical protein
MASPVVNILGVLTLLGAVFLATDPFKYSPIVGLEDFNIEAVPVPSNELLAAIPRDAENKLRSAEIKYGGQIFGPESVVFDSQGRGPYAGVGDGRIVRWDGDEKGWKEFAVVISNRYVAQVARNYTFLVCWILVLLLNPCSIHSALSILLTGMINHTWFLL